MHVSSYCYVCVLILPDLCPHATMCPHTTIRVSAYYYICVLILLYMCPHTTISVFMLLCVLILYSSSYYYMSVLIL